MNKSDGGPAFPFRGVNKELYDELRPTEGVLTARRMAEMMSPGMSLRDWFAGQALAGMMAQITPYALNPHNRSEQDADPYGTKLSRWVFGYADAMLKERER